LKVVRFWGGVSWDAKLASNGILKRLVLILRMEIMEWTAPQFEEVALNCEINSYASAAM
jgi:coenzyme PQQ precursor peptide PqqA